MDTDTNLDTLGTVALRALVRTRGLAKGAAVASARKDDLLALLRGERVTLESPVLASSPVAVTVAGGDGNGDALADVIARAISGRVTAGLDTDAVRAIVDETLTAWATDDLPVILDARPGRGGAPLTISMPEMPAPVSFEGEPVHRQLPQVLAWLRADVPVWLWGAPGSGKTHMGRQLAKALGVDAYIMSVDETTTANKLLGFQNLVSGEFVKGWLYEPFAKGGLVVIDEIDTANPGILAGLNALISNGHYLFPNGETVAKHEKFRVLACANTRGTGAVAGYTARQRLDAATLNRFAVIECAYDLSLECAIACVPYEGDVVTPWKPSAPATTGLCARWVQWVQRVRVRAGKSVLVSPRASILGTRALRAGVPVAEAADALVFALCASDTVETLKGACGDPAALTE